MLDNRQSTYRGLANIHDTDRVHVEPEACVTGNLCHMIERVDVRVRKNIWMRNRPTENRAPVQLRLWARLHRSVLLCQRRISSRT